MDILSSVALVQIAKETTLTFDQQLKPFEHITEKLFCHHASNLSIIQNIECLVIRMNLDLVSSYCCKDALWIARVYYCIGPV